jgi:uncharacterized YigZ family protein
VITDTYKTIAQPTEPSLYKEKNSKFFGYAFPVINEEEVKMHLDTLRKQNPGAVHFCYAYQIGAEVPYFRANDDGEPSNTAGMPIYGQIQSFGLTNILIVVVRYYGGTKLGVGGLIAAYRITAQMVLEQAGILEKTIDVHLQIEFEYKNLNKVMRVIKEKKLQIASQNMELKCDVEVIVRKKIAAQILQIFDGMFGIKISQKE